MKPFRFRFSLRTLLLATLLIASAATLWWNWNPWLPQKIDEKTEIYECGLIPQLRATFAVVKTPPHNFYEFRLRNLDDGALRLTLVSSVAPIVSPTRRYVIGRDPGIGRTCIYDLETSTQNFTQSNLSIREHKFLDNDRYLFCEISKARMSTVYLDSWLMSSSDGKTIFNPPTLRVQTMQQKGDPFPAWPKLDARAGRVAYFDGKTVKVYYDSDFATAITELVPAHAPFSLKLSPNGNTVIIDNFQKANLPASAGSTNPHEENLTEYDEEHPDRHNLLSLEHDDEGKYLIDRRAHEFAFDFNSWRAAPHASGDFAIFFGSGTRDFVTKRTRAESYTLWRQNRPIQWYGPATLPEFWLTAALAIALLASLLHDRKSLLSRPTIPK